MCGHICICVVHICMIARMHPDLVCSSGRISDRLYRDVPIRRLFDTAHSCVPSRYADAKLGYPCGA